VRRRKNNPALLGDPGVGKTAIAEGLAQRIVDGTVPRSLRGKRLLSLQLGLLVADTKYRGEFEERLKQVRRCDSWHSHSSLTASLLHRFLRVELGV